MFTLKGAVHYYNSWVLAHIDHELIRYYRSILPKAWYVQSPRTKAHVSIVRHFENPDKKYWKFLDKSVIEIVYVPEVQSNGVYFWLDCYSEEISIIRKRLGLSKYLGQFNSYHITIGNVK